LLSSFHAAAELYFVPAQLGLAMFGMGATLSVRDFAEVLRDPRGLALGLALQLVLVPLIALAFTAVFAMSEGWAVGLLLVAVVPGGAFSNLLTFLGRGNTPLSISVTVAATSGCIVTVPLVLGIIAGPHLADDFVFPRARIVAEIFAYLLIPLVIGMLVYRLTPRHAVPLSRWAIRGSVLLIVLITVSALGSGRIQVAAYGATPPLLIILFGITLAIVVPLCCRLARRYDDDTVALGIEVIVRNVGVALLLVHFFFPGSEAQGHVLYTCLFYAGMSAFISVPMALLHRAGRSPILLLRPRRR
jgi:bile acid:Na+ symporter, BASS family